MKIGGKSLTVRRVCYFSKVVGVKIARSTGSNARRRGSHGVTLLA